MAKWYLLVLLITLTSLVSASPLLISSTNATVDVIKGSNKEFTINITNTNPYRLLDIKADGEFITSNLIDTLQPNETKQLTLTVNSPQVGDLLSQIQITGFSEVNCSVLGNFESSINITSNGAEPQNIEICKDSSIRFVNSYGNTIRLIISDFGVDEGLDVGNSHVQLYASTGNFVYRIEPLIDLGTIKVVDTAQKLHKSADDGRIDLTIKSRLQATTVEVTFNKNNFNISHDEIGNSFFIIKNTGSVRAENLKFFGEWFNFDANNVNLNANSDRAVNFVVAPTITTASETGKTYSKEIRVTGDNIPESKFNITIFIKSSTIVSGNISSPEWWIKRKEFCSAFPTSPDCITEPTIVFRDKEVFDCPAVLMNVSPKTVQEALQECNNLRGEFNDFSNNVKLDVQDLKAVNAESVTRDQNISQNLEANRAEVSGFRKTVYFIFGLGFLFIICGLLGAVAYGYFIKRRDSLQGSLIR